MAPRSTARWSSCWISKSFAWKPLILIAIGSAGAEPIALTGKYVEVAEAHCVASKIRRKGRTVLSSGFDQDLKPLGKTYTYSFTCSGVRTFHADGSGSVIRRSVNTRIASKSSNIKRIRIPIIETKYEFHYEVAENGTITSQLDPKSFKAFAADESSVLRGLNFTVDGRVLQGKMSDDGQVLTLYSVRPALETVNYSNGDVVERVCKWTSRILINPLN